MIGHLGLNVRDLETTKAYYDQLMPALGFEPFASSPEQFAFRPAAGKPGTVIFFYRAAAPRDYADDVPGLQHLAFMAATRSQVRAIHALVVGLGSAIVHAPRVFPEYPPPYFATFWLDPDGFRLEAVCHHDRD